MVTEKLVCKVLHIDGMSCSGCEMRIENALKRINGVIRVNASFIDLLIDITYDPKRTGLEEIVAVIEKLDYQVINKTKKAVIPSCYQQRQEKMTINQLLGMGIIILAFYLVVKNTVGFNFIPQITQSMGYGIIFVVGLLTSLHCIAMCGGINFSQCVSYKLEDESSKFAKFKPGLFYNTGRMLSYTIIGGVAGALGSAVTFSGTAKGIVAIISGTLMIIMGLNMLNFFPGLKRFNLMMPKVFGSKVYGSVGKYGPFYVGLLNGFMPCGPLQAMQLYALGTGSFVTGALSMLSFSLGTIPLVFGLGAISTFFSGRVTHKMLKVSMVLVVVLGIIMVNRGLNLSGLSGSQVMTVKENIAEVTGNVQVVTTKIEQGGYSPIIVQAGIPVKWIVKADSSDLNGCNNPIIIPEFNIEKKLVSGDNVIKFTPEKEDDIVYTCWMGMIRSTIKVVPDLTKVPHVINFHF